jgi:hypothetical protein
MAIAVVTVTPTVTLTVTPTDTEPPTAIPMALPMVTHQADMVAVEIKCQTLVLV